jgi:hypothetical protein
MLKKMLLVTGCMAVLCDVGSGMQLKSIDAIINAPYPLGRRLAALSGVLVEDHKKIYTFEVTDKKDAEEIVNIFLDEGEKYAKSGKLKEANFVVLLLKNPDEVFCFETSYEMGKFSSKEEYLDVENHVFSFSESKAEELTKLIADQEKQEKPATKENDKKLFINE